MKAAMNGVPQLSILDGWWIEGNVEGRTGWSIDTAHPENLYEKLAEIAACVAEPAAYAQVMQYAIAVNGAHFNTHRMVRQYAQHAYGLVSDECRPRTMRTGAAAS
jgi:starch phosphorylase